MKKINNEFDLSLLIKTSEFGLKDRKSTRPTITASPDIAPSLRNLKDLETVPGSPTRLTKTLQHFKSKVASTINELGKSGSSYFFAGPEWCRQNAEEASQAHARVIIDTYGATYALPNKNPAANLESLQNGTDMYLTYKDGKPVGTACLVPTGNGMAELGRAASHGKVGNRVVQDSRIIGWLSDEESAKKYHTLFATCRTAPDRDTGAPKPMRGGQAVSHMWGEIPELVVGGFGPLYKKHGALETFAYSVLTREKIKVPDTVWVENSNDAKFVGEWCENYHLKRPQVIDRDDKSQQNFDFHPEYPPLESGVTHLVHGEVKLTPSSKSGNLEDSINELKEVGSPFTQVAVPLDRNSLQTQQELTDQGFQAFIFTPGYGDRVPPQLWFGKPNNVPVVPRFWDVENNKVNPFWGEELEKHGKRIAKSW